MNSRTRNAVAAKKPSSRRVSLARCHFMCDHTTYPTKTRIDTQPIARVRPAKGRLRLTCSPPITRPPRGDAISSDDGSGHQQSREEDLHLADADPEDRPGGPFAERAGIAGGVGCLRHLRSGRRRHRSHRTLDHLVDRADTDRATGRHPANELLELFGRESAVSALGTTADVIQRD